METAEQARQFSVSYGREKFPSEYGPEGGFWTKVFNDHGQEVRGRNMRLHWSRYYEIERDGRLFWVVARDDETGYPLGYSCHWWYKDMHFGDIVGADDLWYVRPVARGLGIGRRVKEIGLALLQEAGAVWTRDVIRRDGPNEMLSAMGYENWGYVWRRKL